MKICYDKTVVKFSDYKSKRISPNANQKVIFPKNSLKPRSFSFLPLYTNDPSNPVDRIIRGTIMNPKEKLLPKIPAIKSGNLSSETSKSLNFVNETSGNVDDPGKPTEISSLEVKNGLLKAAQKIATKELVQEDSDESLEEHAYISYSYIEAKKAHMRSLHTNEDRPTRLRKLMNIGSLTRNHTNDSEVWGDTHSFSAAEKWVFAIETVLKMLKTFQHSSSIYDYHSYQDADTIYQLFKYHQEVALSSKIHHYFKKRKKAGLSEPEMMKLNHLLCERIPLFSKLSYEQKVRLCQYVKYEKHSKGVHLFTQGAEAGYIYYLLSGQIQLISKKIESAEVVADHLNIGSIINPDNPDGTWQEHSLRLSSAFLNIDSEFLSLDRRDYWSILRGNDTESDERNRVNILKSLNTFMNEDSSLLEQAAHKTFIKYFPKDTRVVNQGQPNKHIYWILSGEVQVNRTTPFIAKIDARYPARPDTSNNHIHPGEKRVEETLMIAHLSRGGSFPEPFPVTIPIINMTFDRMDLISKIADHEALGLDKSTVTITAITPICCLVMQRIDFCRVMSMEMYTSLHNHSSIYFIKPRPLQLEWITRIKWTKQKKAILREILSCSKSSKDQQKSNLQNWRNDFLEVHQY